MKTETKSKLFEAWAYCDWKDKSTEFMIEYMQDFANVSFDCVMKFISTQGKNRIKWYDKNKNWFKKYE